MKKRVKKYVLNTSNKAHDKMLLRNLLTSLLLRGHLETTEPKAKSLRSFALKAVSKYNKITDPLLRKKWHDYYILSKAYKKRIIANLERLKSDFRISIRRQRIRAGDSAILYKVYILNFDKEKGHDEQN